jgi:hypothetical protein
MILRYRRNSQACRWVQQLPRLHEVPPCLGDQQVPEGRGVLAHLGRRQGPAEQQISTDGSITVGLA